MELQNIRCTMGPEWIASPILMPLNLNMRLGGEKLWEAWDKPYTMPNWQTVVLASFWS